MLRALADAPNVAMTLALVSELIHTERTCAGHTVIRAGSGKWQMRRPCAPGVCAELPNALDLFHNAPAAARRNAVRYALSDALCRPPEPGTEVSFEPLLPPVPRRDLVFAAARRSARPEEVAHCCGA